METQLTERQQRELEYHRERAKEHESLLSRPFSYEILDRPSQRWWNAYWQMYAYLVRANLRGKKVLVVGCGYGEDAIRLSKLGADVTAFDLSAESLSLARAIANREGLNIRFDEMPAESLEYENDRFDCVLARDILHHVDIPLAASELYRVSKNGAVFVINEVYTHSSLDRIRHSRPIEKWLYPAMQSFIYGPGKPYITEDERKLNEKDLAQVLKFVDSVEMEKHFYLFVNRIVPDKIDLLAKLDRCVLACAAPFGRLLAARILLAGRIVKDAPGA